MDNTAVIIRSMAISLILTLALETIFGFLWGIGGKKELTVLFLSNTLTNPIVTSVYYFCAYGMHITGTAILLITLFLEISAVITEGIIYMKMTDIKKPLAFSLCANCFSYFSGLVISAVCSK